MVRLLWTAVFALFVSVAVAEPFQATVTQDVEVRDGALSTDPVVTTLAAGSVVTVRDCILDQCLLDLPDIALQNAPWANDSAFNVEGVPASDFLAEKRLTAKTVVAPVTSSNIRTEGDSYMEGACGISITPLIASATGRLVENTARGGSTMDEAVARLRSNRVSSRITVFWDGSPNGMTSPKEYANALASGLASLGHDRFIVIPAASAVFEDAQAILSEFQARWPDNTLDWRNVLTLTPDGRLDRSNFCDEVHLNEAALTAMASEIAEFISLKEW